MNLLKRCELGSVGNMFNVSSVVARNEEKDGTARWVTCGGLRDEAGLYEDVAMGCVDMRCRWKSSRIPMRCDVRLYILRIGNHRIVMSRERW